MARKSAKTLFVCQSCGYESAKWMGRCTECGAWDTLAEEVRRTAAAGSKIMAEKGNRPVPIDAVEIGEEERLHTGIGEFDRVLGGGLVAGYPGADRRGPGHRQIHAHAPGPLRPGPGRPPGAVCVRRGVDSPTAAAQPAAGDRVARTCWWCRRSTSSAIVAMVASDTAGRARDRFDPDHVQLEI